MNYFMCFVMTFQIAFLMELKAEEEIKVVKKKNQAQGEISKRAFEPRLSRNYYRGEFLIYDCFNGHYACVNYTSWEQCKKWRKIGLDNKDSLLRCAPLKKFKTQKNCFKDQQKQVHQQKTKRFCQRVINY